MLDSSEGSFDPLKGVRKKALTTVDDNRDLLENLGFQVKNQHEQAREITKHVWSVLDGRYGGESVAFKPELTQALENPELSAKIENAIKANTPNPEGLLGSQSVLMSYEIADRYLALVKRLVGIRDDLKDQTPDGLSEGYAMRELIIDGSLKDKLTFLTPNDHRFWANFNRTIKAVNEVIGVPPTPMLDMGEILR